MTDNKIPDNVIYLADVRLIKEAKAELKKEIELIEMVKQEITELHKKYKKKRIVITAQIIGRHVLYASIYSVGLKRRM